MIFESMSALLHVWTVLFVFDDLARTQPCVRHGGM